MRTMMHEAPPVDTEADTAPAPADGVWWTFPALPVHARLARIWLEGWLDAQCPGKEDQAFGALVAFSELVTNSVLHGAGPITVHARLVYGPRELQHGLGNEPRRLLCEVTDRCVDLPLMLDAGPEDEHHRGLSLVDALTASWWVRAAPGGGKTTSFLVELDEG
ncbi:ATP-binding protein [Actinospica sp.]|jgi:anti-sigma regulatory factor (Ser/Thr protein kinase)|uniref:ATP-binding protein n=1 Tax=Actinospica sp. TaxID=1872142 RepID=UPI002C77DC6C|nr:ATP-binding protein [Actinospica sp.]HWG24327.1 ATP-binding protein [Actinospica sp.]